MIRNEENEKCSAKDLANEILAKCLGRIEFWMEANPEAIEGLTKREIDMLNDQIKKQSFRCFKVLGYKPDEMFPNDEDEE